MKLKSLALVALALNGSAYAKDTLILSGGYVEGALSAEVRATSGSALLEEAIRYYVDAGATPQTRGSETDYILESTQQDEALMDYGHDDDRSLRPRYSWQFTIPFTEFTQEASASEARWLRFGGTTARTLIAGMKKTLNPSFTFKDPHTGLLDGNGYAGEQITCEEHFAKKSVICRIKLAD